MNQSQGNLIVLNDNGVGAEALLDAGMGIATDITSPEMSVEEIEGTGIVEIVTETVTETGIEETAAIARGIEIGIGTDMVETTTGGQGGKRIAER